MSLQEAGGGQEKRRMSVRDTCLQMQSGPEAHPVQTQMQPSVPTQTKLTQLTKQVNDRMNDRTE